MSHAKNYPKSDIVHKLRQFLGNGLVTSEGDFWLRQRRMMRPHGPRQARDHDGGGCGRGRGEMEAKLVLATLAQAYRLTLQPGHPVAHDPIITLRPKYGMVMKISPRG